MELLGTVLDVPEDLHDRQEVYLLVEGRDGDDVLYLNMVRMNFLVHSSAFLSRSSRWNKTRFSSLNSSKPIDLTHPFEALTFPEGETVPKEFDGEILQEPTDAGDDDPRGGDAVQFFPASQVAGIKHRFHKDLSKTGIMGRARGPMEP